MENRVLFSALGGVLALIVSLMAGYVIWTRLRSLTGKREKRSWDGQPKAAPSHAAVPLATGICVPLLLFLMLLSPVIAVGDRFYTPGAARHVAAGVVAAVVTLTLRCYLLGPGASVWRRVLAFALDVLAALLVVRAGVQFTYVGAGGGASVELGRLAPFATVCWILFNMYAFRLLDGLDGAVPVLLLTAATAVLVTTWGVNEYFLAALCMVVIGAVLGALRFHFFPARIPLRGPATAVYGLVFAVLTVLARQKTVAVLLLIFPLALILLLLGSTMLGLLERTLLLPERGGEEEIPPSADPGSQEKESPKRSHGNHDA